LKISLKTPLTETDVRELKTTDVILLTGTIYTMRDKASAKAIELLKKGEQLPVNLNNSAIFHAGPLAKKQNEHWELLVIGPTTSARMNKFQPEILKLGVRAIIGKGGMDTNTVKALKKYGGVYLAATGGCAVLFGQKAKIKNVHWIDLGMPDAIWELEVKDFGPLIVAIDSHGNSIYEEVKTEAQKILASF